MWSWLGAWGGGVGLMGGVGRGGGGLARFVIWVFVTHALRSQALLLHRLVGQALLLDKSFQEGLR